MEIIALPKNLALLPADWVRAHVFKVATTFNHYSNSRLRRPDKSRCKTAYPAVSVRNTNADFHPDLLV